jgi:hypothetical protein
MLTNVFYPKFIGNFMVNVSLPACKLMGWVGGGGAERGVCFSVHPIAAFLANDLQEYLNTGLQLPFAIGVIYLPPFSLLTIWLLI